MNLLYPRLLIFFVKREICNKMLTTAVITVYFVP